MVGNGHSMRVAAEIFENMFRPAEWALAVDDPIVAIEIENEVVNPHFSPDFYYGGGSGHVSSVALGRAPRHTVEYACGALRRAPCIHARLRRLATKPGEKCGLVVRLLLISSFVSRYCY
jgi:hypothetical protein